MTAKGSEAQRAPIGLVAGSGVLPRLVLEAARDEGRRVLVVAHEGETDPALADVAGEVHWVRLGQLGRIRQALAAGGVREVCFAGGLTKTRFFRDARPDALGLKVLAKLATSKGDDRLLRAIAGAFEEAGMTLVSATALAPGLLAPEGVVGRRRPSRAQEKDVAFALSIVRELGRLDIGQAVVVKEGVVLAVEATEGTDACIRRGAEQGRGSVVVVKAAKPGQDLRFDLPAVGPATIEVLAAAGGGVLALEAGRTLLLERARAVALADAAKIPIVGVR